MSTLASGLDLAAPAQTSAPAAAPKMPAKPDAQGWWSGTGRRKTAVARVRLKPATGEGKVVIRIDRKKSKTVAEYFTELRDQADVHAPFKVTNTLGKFDVVARCAGGGFMGQAQAVRLAIARALKGYDPSFEDALRDHGFLTRDPREVERKKYGQAGARRRFQFSKR
ncbi:MAG: 30S ribosomal protein S9 [Planctomycetota bacterium]|nr:30S ribosomal protein S9 [Planctomycetota bacterium]